MTNLNESNRQAIDDSVTEAKKALAEMQTNKDYGQVIVTIDVKSGGVSTAHCDKTVTKRVKG